MFKIRHSKVRSIWLSTVDNFTIIHEIPSECEYALVFCGTGEDASAGVPDPAGDWPQVKASKGLLPERGRQRGPL